MSIYSGSRYSTSIVYNNSEQETLIEPRKKIKFNMESATQYTVKQGDTIDGIAYQIYGNAQLWWAIMDSNKYTNELEISIGDVLNIPPYEEVVRYSE